MACIVIADDDVDVAAFITYSFEAAGHRVYPALDGAGALDLVRRYEPDLVVLDHSMPGMTGLEVAATLRADPGTAHLPILMITGSQLGGAELGMIDRVVSKPLRPRQLATIMADMLAQDAVGGR